MKKFIILFALFLLTGCNYFTIEKPTIVEEHEENKENIFVDNIENAQIIIDYIAEEKACDDDSKLFVDIAILGYTTLGNGKMEYYVVANAEGYSINSRGDLISTCGFSIPMSVSLEDGKVTKLVEAKDGNLYDSSIKEMFSSEAYKIWQDAKYAYLNEKSMLEMAEEYFGITVIPEEKNEFECKFCDKIRYYTRTDDEYGENSEEDWSGLPFNYVSEDAGHRNTIYFGSDGTFVDNSFSDGETGTWVFGQNENTVVVHNPNVDHVYDRYVIKNLDENNLNTILEIIQRR